MSKKYSASTVEWMLRYLFEKYHQVENDIDKNCDMGTKGCLHPNLTILLGEIGRIEEVYRAGKKGITAK
jgi:hypothetical protein